MQANQWARKNLFSMGINVSAVPTMGRSAVVICSATSMKIAIHVFSPREQRLAERDAQSEQTREHGVEQRIAERGNQNDEREFDAHVERLHWIAPPTHRSAVITRARDDDRDVKRKSPRLELRRPSSERVRLAPQQNAKFMRVWDGCLGLHGLFGLRRQAKRDAALVARNIHGKSAITAAFCRCAPKFARQS
jgi:hypothetical protein